MHAIRKSVYEILLLLFIFHHPIIVYLPHTQQEASIFPQQLSPTTNTGPLHTHPIHPHEEDGGNSFRLFLVLQQSSIPIY